MENKKIVEGFNRWLDEYIKNPEKFEKEAKVIEEHLREKFGGRTPTYGERCLACLQKYSKI